MTKPDFNAMSKQELRAYVLAHRDDLDALEALFDRQDSTSQPIKFPCAHTEAEWQQQEETFLSLLESKKFEHSD